MTVHIVFASEPFKDAMLVQIDTRRCSNIGKPSKSQIPFQIYPNKGLKQCVLAQNIWYLGRKKFNCTRIPVPLNFVIFSSLSKARSIVLWRQKTHFLSCCGEFNFDFFNDFSNLHFVHLIADDGHKYKYTQNICRQCLSTSYFLRKTSRFLISTQLCPFQTRLVNITFPSIPINGVKIEGSLDSIEYI